MPAGGAISQGAGEIGQSLLGLVSFIRGIGQSKKAKELEKSNKRPIASVPQGVLDATELAKQNATFGLPSAIKLQEEKDISRAGATALGGATDRRGGMETIGAIQQQTNDASGAIATQDAAAMAGKEGQLIAQEDTLGAWQDKAWDWNSRQKFQENAQAIVALKGAANENFNTALNMGASALATAANKGDFSSKGTDPTISNPDLYGGGVPVDYASYLQNIRNIRGMTGSFQSSIH